MHQPSDLSFIIEGESEDSSDVQELVLEEVPPLESQDFINLWERCE